MDRGIQSANASGPRQISPGADEAPPQGMNVDARGLMARHAITATTLGQLQH